MKYLHISYFLGLMLFFLGSCSDDILQEKEISKNEDDFNIEAFKEGYSLAFDVSLDRMGGSSTRADETPDDAKLIEWENHLDPEEFRILFFDSQDRFIFESRSRWFTRVSSDDGKTHWRVGVPVFQYLSDNFDDVGSNDGVQLDDDAKYNWDRIIEILKKEDFKIAILANRPSDINIPELSDLSAADRRVKTFGKNGPFWNYQNSVASYDYPDDYPDLIKKVFDLHHCQYDPLYENKNSAGNCYSFIMEEGLEDIGDEGMVSVPKMGAVSSWIHPTLTYTIGSSAVQRYRLPEQEGLPSQYIPMYGIQKFAALSSWVKGTTFNLSEQTASQTGEYDYKTISLLRSVVKIELRIPMYDLSGNYVDADNESATIFANNFLARCEPMDVSTPTNEIWKDNHTKDCEWNNIKNYGLYADGKSTDYIDKLSWFYGIWKDSGWTFGDLGADNIHKETDDTKYPRIFNPITQRLTCTSIQDCFLPIEDEYYRWVVYCGEKNINDPNPLNNLIEDGLINYFRIKVTIKSSKTASTGTDYIYHIPLTDYSIDANPAHDILKTQGLTYVYNNNTYNYLEQASYTPNINNKITETNPGYFAKVKALSSADNDKNGKYTYKDMYPYPLLRNHFYRVTVSYGDGDDINVEVIDGEKRTVGGIIFK